MNIFIFITIAALLAYLKPVSRGRVALVGVFILLAAINIPLQAQISVGSILWLKADSGATAGASADYLVRKYGITVPPPPLPPDSTFTEIPKSMQLYARESNDSAEVEVAGTIWQSGYDSIYVAIARNDQPWMRVASALTYSNGAARFDLRPSIHAELSEYRFSIGIKSATRDSVLAVRDSIVCGDVFLINGQSNSIEGNASTRTYEFCRTFGKNFSPSARDTLWELAQSDEDEGGPRVGAWGLRMQQLLTERAGVPICIINGGVPGTAVEQHQRNDADPTDLQTIYGSMLYRVSKSGLQQKAKGLLWYQGEANTIMNYYLNFKALYEDWRVDYPSLRKFYVVQIRPGCNNGSHLALRELLRTLPDSLPDIESFSVMGVPGHDGCHYLPAGYDTIGTQLYRLLARDFYGSADTVEISAPNIRKAFFTDDSHTTIALLLTNASRGLTITPDTLVGGVTGTMKDAFFLDDTLSFVQSVRVASDTLFLMLSTPYPATTITYIPDHYYPNGSVIYEGPWMKNLRGVGAFSFYRFPITSAEPTMSVDGRKNPEFQLVAQPNPFSMYAELRVILSQAQPAEVVLYDAVGREVWHERFNARSGENSVTIQRRGLASGLYLCKLICREGEDVVALVVR